MNHPLNVEAKPNESCTLQ